MIEPDETEFIAVAMKLCEAWKMAEESPSRAAYWEAQRRWYTAEFYKLHGERPERS